MTNVYKALGLLLLLLTAQHGAVDHELSHIFGSDRADLRIDAGGAANSPCALCPAFAQVVTPTFGHSFEIPLLVRTGSQLSAEPQFEVLDAAVPRPRSRGPPSSS
jgi:hypothetical protein